MKRPFGFAWIVGLVILGTVASASGLLADMPQEAPPADASRDDSAESSAVPSAENDSLCEIAAAGPMCCDASPSQNDSLYTVGQSLMTAGTAAVGLAVVGLLIKRRRGG